MEFSLFGEKFTRHAGITQLMDDPQSRVCSIRTPSCWEAAIRVPHPRHAGTFQTEAKQLLDNGELIKAAMANYDARKARTGSLRRWPSCSRELGWDISARNIAPTNGSQKCLLLSVVQPAGRREFADGRKKKVLFLAPNTSAMRDSAWRRITSSPTSPP